MRHISAELSYFYSSVLLNVILFRVWDEPSEDLSCVLSGASSLIARCIKSSGSVTKARHTKPVTAKFGANRIRFLLHSTHDPAIVTRPLSLCHTHCSLILQAWNFLSSYSLLRAIWEGLVLVPTFTSSEDLSGGLNLTQHFFFYPYTHSFLAGRSGDQLCFWFWWWQMSWGSSWPGQGTGLAVSFRCWSEMVSELWTQIEYCSWTLTVKYYLYM